MGRSPLDAVLPALSGSIDDRRWLAVADLGDFALRSQNLLEVLAIWNQDDVPVVEIGQLHGIPLDVIAGHISVTADAV